MIKIYTPEQWYSIFGRCPTLIIDDQGRIWSADAYFKPLFGEPSGMVDYKKGRIYGPDYSKLSAVPIARMETRNGETRIYNYADSFSAPPMLYIIGDRIYTPDQYITAGLGGDSVGYIRHSEKPENRNKDTEKPGGNKEHGSDSGFGSGLLGMENIGCFGIIVVILLLGKALDYLPDLPVIVWFGVAAAVVIIRELIIRNGGKSDRAGWWAKQMSGMSAGKWVLTVFLFIVGFSALSGISPLPAGFGFQVLKRLALFAIPVIAALVFYFKKIRRK